MIEPERVRITHPRTEAARRSPARSISRDIDEQTVVGEVFMRALLRSQRRVAAIVTIGVAVLLAGTAVLGAAWPGFGSIHVLGVPLPWLILGVGIYPVLVGLGWYAVRQAERNERDFLDLVRHR